MGDGEGSGSGNTPIKLSGIDSYNNDGLVQVNVR